MSTDNTQDASSKMEFAGVKASSLLNTGLLRPSPIEEIVRNSIQRNSLLQNREPQSIFSGLGDHWGSLMHLQLAERAGKFEKEISDLRGQIREQAKSLETHKATAETFQKNAEELKANLDTLK